MPRGLPWTLLAAALLCAGGCGQPTTETTETTDQTSAEVLDTENVEATMNLRSLAFEDGGNIPAKYTCDGQDISPPLSWDDVPEGVETLALIVEDPDAPKGTFTHWVLFNLPTDRTSLEENVPKDGEVAGGARQGTNGFKKVGYGGPCPPSGTHRYIFTLYGLDTTLDLAPKATKEHVLEAMKGHVKAEGRLVGRYSRS